jgi:hypothetical protein
MVHGDIIDPITTGMIKRFDEAAAWIAYELAEMADALPGMLSAETWRDIGDSIERRLSTDGREQILTVR